MFYFDGNILKSSLLDKAGIVHGFGTRNGGVSTEPHTKSFNVGENLGDSHETVMKNKDIFASLVSGGVLTGKNTVTAHQIHSAYIREIESDNLGEGYDRNQGEDCDGYITSVPGVMPIVKTADCTPILLCGTREDGSHAVSAVHAGWRGTAKGIAAEAVRLLREKGCTDIIAAIGPHIGFCCYEVGDDFIDAVKDVRGNRFAEEYVRMYDDGRYHADLTGMNYEILIEAGVRRDRIDISSYCTACETDMFFSHRAMNGKRGTMGSGIAILPDNI